MRLAALCITLAAALSLAFVALRPPSPVPADAPASAFSAQRAYSDVMVMAKSPHPVGSPANAQVRDFLLARLTALGLAPEVQPAFALRKVDRLQQPLFVGGQVENIVGVLPGRDRTAPALAIMAHYDTVPGSPGAGDDAAGVAAALELARILRLQGTPARDVIFLITDGEEAGLLGADAAFTQTSLARRVGFLINMEARGGGGLAQMFQTGARNAGTVEVLRQNASQPSASSLAVLLYSAMPNDTDFTVSRAAGIDGLNFAFIGRQFDYHAASATPEALQLGSLQHMGDQVTAAARALAYAPRLPERGADQVFSHVFGDFIIAYPTMAGWLVLAASAGLLALAVRNARRLGILDAPGVARGVGAAIYLLLLSAALLHLARLIAADGGGFLEQRPLLARAATWETALLFLGLSVALLTPRLTGTGRGRLVAAALGLAAAAAAQFFSWDLAALALGGAAAVCGGLTFGAPVRIAPAWTGVLATALVVSLGLQIAAPTAAFLVAWPLLAACFVAALTSLGGTESRWRIPLLGVLIGTPTTAWLLGYAHGVFLGLDLPALLAVFGWLCMIGLWPMVQGDPGDKVGDRRIWLAAAAALALGLGLSALVRLAPPWSARHPQATIVQHLQDAGGSKAYTLSTEPHLSAWTRRVLARGGERPVQTRDELVARAPFWASPAPIASLAGATVALQATENGRQRLTVTVPAGVRGLGLDLRSDTLVGSATVNGRPAALMAAPGVWNRIRLQAPPGTLAVEFTPAGPGRLEVRTLTRTEGWPLGLPPLPARSPREMAFGDSDTALVRDARTFSW